MFTVVDMRNKKYLMRTTILVGLLGEYNFSSSKEEAFQFPSRALAENFIRNARQYDTSGNVENSVIPYLQALETE